MPSGVNRPLAGCSLMTVRELSGNPPPAARTAPRSGRAGRAARRACPSPRSPLAQLLESLEHPQWNGSSTSSASAPISGSSGWWRSPSTPACCTAAAGHRVSARASGGPPDLNPFRAFHTNRDRRPGAERNLAESAPLQSSPRHPRGPCGPGLHRSLRAAPRPRDLSPPAPRALQHRFLPCLSLRKGFECPLPCSLTRARIAPGGIWKACDSRVSAREHSPGRDRPGGLAPPECRRRARNVARRTRCRTGSEWS